MWNTRLSPGPAHAEVPVLLDGGVVDEAPADLAPAHVGVPALRGGGGGGAEVDGGGSLSGSGGRQAAPMTGAIVTYSGMLLRAY